MAILTVRRLTVASNDLIVHSCDWIFYIYISSFSFSCIFVTLLISVEDNF